MSTNGVYGQMQAWLNKHGENTNNYASAMDNIEKQLSEISEKLQGSLSGTEKSEISSKLDDLEIEQLQAKLDYLKGEKETGQKFNFMEGDYDPSDAETFVPAYVEQTGKLAQGDMEAWETDGEEGISLEEYTNAQLGAPNLENMEEDEYSAASAYAQKSFETIDIDGDGILEKNEMQGFYAALDNADGSVDGQLEINAIGTDLTSDRFKMNIQAFQAYLKEEE